MDNQEAVQISEQSKPQGSRFPLGPKLIFVILGIVLVIELFFAIKTLSQPTPPPPPKLAPLTGAKIVLVSPETSYNVGDTVPVAIRLTTGGRSTIGTDLILKFDPKILEATQGAVKRGSIYQEYPVTQLDSKGTVRISGISTQNGYNGIGVFGSVIFKAKVKGQTRVAVDFQKDSTTDSNVVEAGSTKDILDQVFNLELTIR